MSFTDLDCRHMRRALQLAERGRGAVEPNPMVGCVLARGQQVLGEGWHAQFGGPHAEVVALQAAGAAAAGATLYVTLEPCCHQGKTPPCTGAVIAAGVQRVVVGHRDPFPAVAGGGLAQLAAAGLDVAEGLLADEAARLNAPYLKLVTQARPWVIAKWAMTLDGKLAARTGHSQWISGTASREAVHRLRGRMDAIVVGRHTVEQDDPQLTARPPGPRTALRVVLDSIALLPRDCRLVRTARQTPVLVAVGPAAAPERCQALRAAGCEVWAGDQPDRDQRLLQLLDELGRRRLTNVLVEGGGHVLGSFFDAAAVDEVHVFLAAKLVGGQTAPTPLGGAGLARMSDAWSLEAPAVERLGEDVYVHGRLQRAVRGSPTSHLAPTVGLPPRP